MARLSHHVVTERQDVGQVLAHRLATSNVAHLATAYLTADGLDRFQEAMEKMLRANGRARLLVGTRDYVTQPRALSRLLRLEGSYPASARKGLEVRLAQWSGFHWKLALLRKRTWHGVIVGSSNLTGKGLRSDGEINIEVTNSVSLYGNLLGEFDEEFFHGRPLADAFAAYQSAYRRHARLRRRVRATRRRAEVRTRRPRRVQGPARLNAGNYPVLRITSEEEDEALSQNADSRVADEFGAVRGGDWISRIPRAQRKRCGKGSAFVLVDELGYRVGFAISLWEGTLSTSSGRRAGVVFYRWRRGLSRRCASEADLRAFITQRISGLGWNRDAVGSALSARLLEALGGTVL